jgi:endogenous inhibitor of DNA gyrase (YacG/DUF329 family)
MEQPAATGRYVCPTCGKGFAGLAAAEQKPAWFPFCSDRCQWIDLGKWLTDRYRISEDLPPGDE